MLKAICSDCSAHAALVHEWNLLLHEYPLLLTPLPQMRPGYPCDHDETFEGVKDLFDSSILQLWRELYQRSSRIRAGRSCGWTAFRYSTYRSK